MGNSFFILVEIYNDVQNTLKNKTENYIDDITTKTERIFRNFLFSDENTINYIIGMIKLAFINFEKNEKFLFLKIMIPLLENLKIYQSQNLNKEKNVPLELYLENLEEKYQVKDENDLVNKMILEEVANLQTTKEEEIKRYELLFDSFSYFLIPKSLELNFSIFHSLFEYIEINLKNMNITKDDDVKKEIKNLIEYLSKFNSLKHCKIYYEMIIFSLQMYLQNNDFYEEEIFKFEQKAIKENLNENNIIILIEKNISDFKYKILTLVEKKKKAETTNDSKIIKEIESVNSIHLYETKKQLMKDKYMNAIIYESQRVPIIIDKNYSLLEILILKINIENIKKVQKDIIQEIEEISEKFNNFKSYEKIYFNVNNKFIYFDKDCYNKEGKYEALKKEISENIKKMKLKEEIE